jgi:hypothetical protein
LPPFSITPKRSHPRVGLAKLLLDRCGEHAGRESILEKGDHRFASRVTLGVHDPGEEDFREVVVIAYPNMQQQIPRPVTT